VYTVINLNKNWKLLFKNSVEGGGGGLLQEGVNAKPKHDIIQK
jgi:hypothetical protein